jgi:hypothetical protein
MDQERYSICKTLWKSSSTEQSSVTPYKVGTYLYKLNSICLVVHMYTYVCKIIRHTHINKKDNLKFKLLIAQKIGVHDSSYIYMIHFSEVLFFFFFFCGTGA